MDCLTVKTHGRNEMIDVTDEIAAMVRKAGMERGSVLLFVRHTTAGVTINENADPDVVHDLLLTLEELFPQNRRGYRHAEGNSDAHVKSSLVGVSLEVPVENGKLMLGTWQGIYFCEFDGPRSRQLHVTLRPA